MQLMASPFSPQSHRPTPCQAPGARKMDVRSLDGGRDAGRAVQRWCSRSDGKNRKRKWGRTLPPWLICKTRWQQALFLCLRSQNTRIQESMAQCPSKKDWCSWPRPDGDASRNVEPARTEAEGGKGWRGDYWSSNESTAKSPAGSFFFYQLFSLELCGAAMPTSGNSKLRRKGCSLARRTRQQATAAWRLLYRLLFIVTRRLAEVAALRGLGMLFKHRVLAF